MTRYVVLLRGINVGRAKRVGMAELRELLGAEGYEGVATALQSGNVVLDAGGRAPALARAVEGAIRQRFGFPVDVIVRTATQFRTVLAKDPLGDVATDGATYLVAFLPGPADGSLAEALRAVDLGDDRYVLDRTELYLWCPRGQMQSPLMTALSALKGGPPVTVRNWNTVQKIGALLDR